MNFNIDPFITLDSIIESLESAGKTLSEEQFTKIANAIETAMPGVLQVIVQGTAEQWKKEAKEHGGGWGEKYAQAIKYQMNGNQMEVFVDEDMIDKSSNKPNLMFVKMVEEGMKSFSIKDGLLASDKAKIGKDGIRYIIVPFPVATPRRASSGKARSMFDGREMTAEMYRIVKSGGKLTSGTLKSGSRDIDVSGLTKYNTRQLHSQYGIFRCVSEKSSGWIHPGVPSDPVYPLILEFINRQIREIMSEFCRAIVQEYSK